MIDATSSPTGLTAQIEVNVSTSIFTIYRMAGGKGVAFGTVSSRFGVEVAEAWPFYTHGEEIQELVMNMAHPVGSILSQIRSDLNPNTLWPWTQWAQLSDETISSGTLSITAHRWLRIY